MTRKGEPYNKRASNTRKVLDPFDKLIGRVTLTTEGVKYVARFKSVR